MTSMEELCKKCTNAACICRKCRGGKGDDIYYECSVLGLEHECGYDENNKKCFGFREEINYTNRMNSIW